MRLAQGTPQLSVAEARFPRGRHQAQGGGGRQPTIRAICPENCMIILALGGRPFLVDPQIRHWL